MDYAILATLWNGPTTLPELVAALHDRMARPVSVSLVESHLRMLVHAGFAGRDERSTYTLAERGSVYLANAAVPA